MAMPNLRYAYTTPTTYALSTGQPSYSRQYPSLVNALSSYGTSYAGDSLAAPSASWDPSIVAPVVEMPVLQNYAPIDMSAADAIPAYGSTPGSTSWFDGLGATITNGLKGTNQYLKDIGFSDTIDPATKQTLKGWGGLAIGAAQLGMNAYMGMQQYNLAKDSLDFSKSQFNKNFAAQRGLINSQLADRQRRRINEGRATGTVEEYMSKYGVA